jgi:predicted DCC family thiol-disulfide oxidoreductase YuxK
MNTKQISPWQFTFFRIAFGTYLFCHFLGLIPYAAELFSNSGALADPRLNFTFGVLPNPLESINTATFAVGFVTAMASLAALFALGIGRRFAALLLWFGWACLFNRNNLICNPGLPYVGLLLLLSTLVPVGEPLRWGKRDADTDWQMPAAIYWVAWLLLAIGYTYSGWFKLLSPSWQDGSALESLIHNPLARPSALRNWLITWPPLILQIATWIALAGELLALPLSLTRKGRLITWLWMLSMHLGIILLVDFADLTWGMLMVHLFTFDPQWLPARTSKKALLLFDGDCGLCQQTVRFFLSEDTAKTFSFAPLQGTTAQPILRRHGLGEASLRSVILVTDAGTPVEKIYCQSDAVLSALALLGGGWRLLACLRLVPQSLRDLVYDYIARNRYRFWPKAEACPLPKPAWRERILT